jgi:CRP/FNR family cyclic AMP-dependent transcriptional regulator
MSILQYLTKEEMGILAAGTRLVSIVDGPVFQENDVSDGLFIIRSGTAKVTKLSEFGKGEAVLNLLKSGDSFGEIGLVDGLPRTASVTAIGPVECWFLSRDAFLKILEGHPRIAISMMLSLAAMIRHADEWVARSI